MMAVALATEDALSEAIGLRLLSELPRTTSVNHLLRKDGSGYLRSRMDSWRKMAQRQVVLILTDLDQIACPLALREDWFGNTPLHANLMLRIAVREVESWVLADHEAMRELIGIKGKLPAKPDELPDPKRHLLDLAKYAPRAIRQDLVKEYSTFTLQGIGYNARLTHLVKTVWSPERAALRSPSLQRTRHRLNELLLRPDEV